MEEKVTNVINVSEETPAAAVHSDKLSAAEKRQIAEDVFKTLQGIDLSEKHKTKNGMSYLPWANAWMVMMKYFPDFREKVVKDENGNLYHTDGRTCWVETAVTIGEITRNQTLAVMNNKNQSIPLENITSVDVNKSIQRCLTKNFAKFGLDINLWVGEEVSDDVKAAQEEEKERQAKELKDLLNEISKLGTEMIAKGYTPEELYKVVSGHNNGNKNPNAIKDIEVANKVLATLQAEDKKLKKEKKS